MTDVREIIFTTIIGGFTLVMSLAINNLIQNIINANVKEDTNSLAQQAKYTFIIIIITSIIIYFFAKAYSRLNSIKIPSITTFQV